MFVLLASAPLRVPLSESPCEIEPGDGSCRSVPDEPDPASLAGDAGGRAAGRRRWHPSVIPWFKERDGAPMGSDHPTYVAPSELPGAVHDFALLYLGVHMFDNCDLEALGEAAAERSRCESLRMAAPLPIRGGTGSPLNPIAVF